MSRSGDDAAVFEEIVRRLDDPVMLQDRDGRFRVVNDAVIEHADRSRSELLGADEFAFMDEATAATIAEMKERVADEERAIRYEVSPTFEDGRSEAFSTLRYPYYDEADEVDGTIAICRKVTELKERERELRTFEKAVESAGSSIYVTDTDGTIEHVNPAFEANTGYAREEAVGERPSILKSGEHGEDFYEELWETILAGDVWESEIVNERKDGERFVVNQTIAPVLDENGDVERFVAVNNEITERKEYERTLEEQRDRLELLNQVVRHDIRNDLTVIKGRARMLEEHVDEAEEEHLREIGRSAEKATERMKTARDLTRTMLRQDERLEAVRLDRVLESRIDAIRSQHEHAILTTDGILPEVSVRADPMLEAVFENLLQNAILHNDEDIPEVTVGVDVGDETVVVSVADNGPGVPDAQKEAIFGKGEKSLDSPGTGLGLYLVRTLVDRYGGEVWVEDRRASDAPGGGKVDAPDGAVFKVRLERMDR